MTTSLVTGANRGIGKEVAIQLGALGHHVLVGSRDAAKAAATVDAIASTRGRATALPLDIANPESVDRAVAQVENLGELDVLVNNAAITYDTWQSAINPDFEVVREALETNLFGTWQLTAALAPRLRASSHGRIVNVSSGAGALDDMGGRIPAYRVSKVSLNALTRMWAAELPGVLVNSVCPGWVATDMGGSGGRPVSDGAAGIVWAATLPDDGPTGGFFRDQQAIPW
ncbi:MAG: SDR family NAD(P)-dependent oxidoreductase [Acidimicrobiia bacterium]|nr:SDR family NAD(P)-dependent oxidoreductase [Acidimicrobiia bacterium]